MRFPVLFRYACTALALSSCSTSSGPAPVKLGMTKEEVRTLYGAPSRIEKHRSGGESWHYPVKVTEKGTRVYDSSSAVYEPYKRAPSTFTSSITFEPTEESREQPGSIDFNASGLVEAVPNGVPIRQ